ncbi:MAG: hypothetical protein QGG40_17785 [Myxococcota bacterium]|jgi:chromosome segregation ATPase|nr:hypothetical protein [Myxococcota bacterium]
MSESEIERIAALQDELESILETRLQELAAAMTAAESTTRSLVSAQVECERLGAERDGHQAQVTELETQLEEARLSVASEKEAHIRLVEELSRLRHEERQLQLSAREARGQISNLQATHQTLETQMQELQTENASLETKRRTLEDNLARMRTLNEELMLSITGLTEEMVTLVGGRKE